VSVKPKVEPAAVPVPESVTPSSIKLNSRSRRSKSATPASTTPQQTPEASPADPNVCRRCARWGITCIHVRNAKRPSQPLAPPAESVT
jgi:hypothetical protein